MVGLKPKHPKLGILVVAGLMIAELTVAQSVGIGTSTPDPTARLDIWDTVRGLLIPRLTTQQRDAIQNPAHTLMIFNIDSFCLEVYDTVMGRWWVVSCPRYCQAPGCMPVIQGPPFVCAGDTVAYSVTGCTEGTFLWTVPGSWMLLGGQGTNTIQVVPDTVDGSLSVRVCTQCGCGNTVVYAVASDSCFAWCAVYGGSNNDEGYNLAIAPNGNLVVTGATNSFGAGGYDNYLLYIDHWGNKVWDRTYGTTSDDYYSIVGRNVLPLQNRILVGGELLVHGDGLVFALDYNGNILWGRQITAFHHSGTVAPYLQGNNQYIVVGYASTWIPGLFVVNGYGNVLQGYQYTPSCGATPLYFLQLRLLSANGYFAVLRGRCPSPYRMWLGFLTSGLDLLWARRYEISIPPDPQTPVGDIAIWSSSVACGALGYGFACVDTLGNPHLEVYFPNQDVVVSGIVTTPQKTLVVCGWTSALAQFGGEDAFLMEVDSQGNVLRAYVMGGAGTDRLYAAEIDSAGHLVFAGWTDSYGSGGRDVWVVHLPYASWDIPGCTNCQIAPVTPTITLSMPSTVHTFTRSSLSGVQPGGQGNLANATEVICHP